MKLDLLTKRHAYFFSSISRHIAKTFLPVTRRLCASKSRDSRDSPASLAIAASRSAHSSMQLISDFKASGTPDAFGKGPPGGRRGARKPFDEAFQYNKRLLTLLESIHERVFQSP